MSGTSDVRRKTRKLGTWYKNSTSIVTLDVFSVILNFLWSSTVPLVSTSKHMKALLLHRGFATLSFRAQTSKRIMILQSMLTLAKQTTTLHIVYASHHPWNVIRLLSTWRPTWLVAINHVSSTILINDSFKVKYQWKKLMTYPLTRHLRAWFYRIPIRSRSQRHLQSLLVLLMLTTLTLLHSSDHWLIELSIDEADFPLKAWNANSVLNLAVVPSKSTSHVPFTWDSTWRSQIGITFPFLSQQCAIPHGLRGIITNLIVWNGSIILTMSRTLALFTDLAFARRLSWETIPTDPIPLDKKAKRQMWRILSKSWWSKCTTKDSSSNLFGIAAHLNLQLMRHSKLETPNWRRHRLHPSLSINGWKGTNHPIVTTGKAVDPVRL